MKYCILVIDGASGLPVEELGGMTCLEAASTPNLDDMARRGRLGLTSTVPEGMEPSSAAACTSILGFDPAANYIGRGAIEAASLGIPLTDGETAFRCNLVHVADGIMRDYSAGHITSEESRRVIARLDKSLGDPQTRFHPGLGYRHILTLRDGGGALDATCTPPHDIPDQPIAGHLPRGSGANRLLALMEQSVPLLAEDPVNLGRAARGLPPASMIWLFWGGAKPARLSSFSDIYGLHAALTSAVDLLGGLAVIFGLTRLNVLGVTDGADNDYVAQAEGGLAALQDHDLVIMHVESPDEAGHSGDFRAKIEAIRRIDADMASRLLAYEGDLRILAMPDHPTPVARRTHTPDPVPFVLSGPGIEPNGADTFTEARAASTGLFLDKGWQLMGMLLGQG